MQTIWSIKGDVKDLIITIAWLILYAPHSTMYGSLPWYVGKIIDKVERMLNDHKNATTSVHLQVEFLTLK